MTALADIGKAHHMTVAALKGSDLTEFNESHPRDQAGRFAAASGGVRDPRMERKARRLRKIRRAQKAMINAANVPQAAAPKEAEVDLSSLRRERERPRRADLNTRNTKQGVRGKPEAKKEGVDLTDESYGRSEGTTDIQDQSLIVLSREKFDEFISAGSMAAGAAEKKWGAPLTAHMVEGDEQSVASQVLREQVDFSKPYSHDLVALRLNDRFRSVSSGEGQVSFVLASDHVLAPSFPQPKHGIAVSDFHSVHERPGGITQDDDYAPPSGSAVMIPVVDVDIVKAAIWEDDEHPRDPRSGRFAPAGEQRDPRLDRMRRRKRRAARAASNDLRVRHEPSAEEREEVREYPERARARRADLNRRGPRTRPAERSGSGKEQEGAPTPVPPKRKPGIIQYGDIGAGGRILSEEEWRAARRPRTGPVRTQPAGQIPVSDFLPKKTKAKPVEAEETFGGPMKETQAPVELIWVNGEPANLAEFQAYHSALKAARARKRGRSRS